MSKTINKLREALRRKEGAVLQLPRQRFGALLADGKKAVKNEHARRRGAWDMS